MPTVNQHIKQLAADAPLALRFQGATADECRAWQEKFAAKLRELLGPHRPPAKWRVELQETAELADHRRETLLLHADGHPSLPMYLLIPKTSEVFKGKRPGIVALHGHGAHGYHPVAGRDDLPGVAKAIESASYDYGRQLVRRGYVVAVPCMTPFGPRLGPAAGKQDPCAIAFIRLQLLGKVLMAENLRDCLWAVEFLARRPDVDAERLGCVGLSYGGRMTMLTAALEPRIKAAVVSGALNVMQERIAGQYSCGAQVIPGLLKYGDIPEIAGLIAPRPCLWEVGAKDTLIAPKWAELALSRIRPAYAALGAEKNLRVDRFDGGHRWHGVEAYEFLKAALDAK
ncbi:MAG: prolyl oligopeptidase family serine peptidase [Gemmataceae bacterium]|nr:prolyl oligopeptidase family serine peptidase [Gemmataceae bacterium]